MSAIDAAIVGAFLVYVIVNGLRERARASGGLEQYFLAGRSLSGWQAGISMAATQFAADTPLLVTGLVAMGGIFALWRLWIYALAFLVLAFLLAACWRRAGVLTDAEFAELRYPGRGAAALRLFKALYFGTLFNCVVLAIVLLATTRIAEPFLLWNEWLPPALFRVAEGIAAPFAGSLTVASPDDPAFTARAASNLISLVAIALVTLAYSTLGGLRSVVQTDVVQFAIMMVASLAYAVVVVNAAGGLGPMVERLHAAFAQGTGPLPMNASQLLAFTPSAAYDVGALLLAVFLLQWLIQVNADGTGYLAQRAMACRDDHEASRAAVVFTFAQIVLRSLIWLPIALGLLLVFPPDGAFGAAGEAGYVAAREASYVRGMAELLPVGLKGLMLTAMIAALASTIDTHLNWGAAYWTNDIYARARPGLGGAPVQRPAPRAGAGNHEPAGFDQGRLGGEPAARCRRRRGAAVALAVVAGERRRRARCDHRFRPAGARGARLGAGASRARAAACCGRRCDGRGGGGVAGDPAAAAARAGRVLPQGASAGVVGAGGGGGRRGPSPGTPRAAARGGRDAALRGIGLRPAGGPRQLAAGGHAADVVRASRRLGRGQPRARARRHAALAAPRRGGTLTSPDHRLADSERAS